MGTSAEQGYIATAAANLPMFSARSAGWNGYKLCHFKYLANGYQSWKLSKCRRSARHTASPLHSGAVPGIELEQEELPGLF